jgi:CPA1 family monovalent cation:H+ antiporter
VGRLVDRDVARVSPATFVFWGLLSITIFAVAARFVRQPYPIVMLAGGILLAFIPGLPMISLEPDVVFLVILPMLLFGAGWTTDFREFRTYLKPILWLALGLVGITTVVVAYVAHAWLGLPLAAAFVLGAVVSPSDTVAMEAIAEAVPFPRAALAILSGESLVNDAAALVIYAFSVAAVSSGTFAPGAALIQLVYVSLVGVTIGIAVAAFSAWLLVSLRRSGLADQVVTVLFSITTPFLVYLLAQSVNASGVLASVAAGIFLSARAGQLFDAQSRIAASGVWELVTFLLNGFAFILIGLQLPSIFGLLGAYSPLTLAGYGLGISLVVILVRFAALLPAALLRSRSSKREGTMFDWRQAFLIGWCGMRGIVTLATALAVPATTANGQPFPGRALILFVAFAVILTTLVVQGLSLPLVAARIHGAGDDDAPAIASARARTAQAARTKLQELELAFETTQQWEIASRLIAMLEQRMRFANGELDAVEGERSPVESERELRLELYAAERAMLVQMRKAGEISDRVYRHVQWEIDLAQSQLQHFTG